MEIGLVQRINIDNEMQQAYLDYAMSVIVARALPDARDGLKPVHRRILYAMYDMGIRPDSAYKKSARIVGEVLGKYHPHGDAAVYEAMARMAQDFSLRYLLVDGQGNFGSVDGDAPAAMRYTEARLAAPANQMLTDIQKDTVDFSSNFDGTLVEPNVLPAAIPNLLINGATGIAVGMATSIPPHNLGEVVDALHFMLNNWEKLDDLNVEDLMNFVHGPDFPTGGIIIQEEESDGLISAYSTGRGRVTVQASAHLEEMERGRNRIIITELPYMTNKSSLIERIASLVREERLEGIADLRDESDRQGMRIVIELNKAAEPEAVLTELYKSTPMQSTFSIIMLALVDGEPRLLSLKQSLRVFIEHRLEIVRRRSEFDLEKARQRAHILEGYLIALRNLDEVITIIRKSPDAETARDRLIKRFKLSVIQAQAILDMPLRRLAALERKKIEEEYKEVQALIKDLTALLRSPKKMREVISQELQAVKEAFGDRRRTHIARLKAGASKVSMLTAADLKPDKQIWLAISTDGLIARSPDDRPPTVNSTEAPLFLIQANTRDTLYLVSDQGEAAAIAVHALPEGGDLHSGLPVHKVTALKDGQKVAALFSLPPKERRGENGEEGYVLTATRQGMLKKSALAELPGPAAAAFTLAKVNPGDQLAWVRLTGGADELVLVSSQGMAIRFSELDIRPMGLAAAGVMGMKLQDDDALIGAELVNPKKDLFLLASDGNAKRVAFEQFTRQGRYGQGIIAWKLTPKTQIAGVASGSGATACWVHRTKSAPKIIRLDAAPLAARTARGHAILELKGGDQVAGLCLWEGAPAAQETAPAKRPKTVHPAESGGGASPKNAAPGPGRATTAPVKAKQTRPAEKPTTATTPKKDGATPQTTQPAAKTTQTATEPASPTEKTASAPAAKTKPQPVKSTAKPAAKTTAGKETPSGRKTSPPAAKVPAPPAKPSVKPTASTTSKPADQKSAPKAKTTPEKAASGEQIAMPLVEPGPSAASKAKSKAAAGESSTKTSPGSEKTTAKQTIASSPKKATQPAEKATSQLPAPAIKKSGAKAAGKPAPPPEEPSKAEKPPASKKTPPKKTGAS